MSDLSDWSPMYKFRTRSCVSPRTARKPAFAVVYSLLSVMISLCVACATRSDAGAPCPAIEMTAVTATQTDSTRTVTLNDTTTIRISRTPLVVTADITAATASQANDKWVVDFTVTDDAAKRVREFSAGHVGTNLAVVVDGKVHGTPRIAGAITGNRYQIEGFTQADAERLATAISNGCPPAR
jgi:preprotein translocase subunit SecD